MRQVVADAARMLAVAGLARALQIAPQRPQDAAGEERTEHWNGRGLDRQSHLPYLFQVAPAFAVLF